MFRTFSRKFLPNRFDWMLKKTAKNGGRRILLGWNRGLGDIALGLYAMVTRIRELVPNAEITFVTRENLKDGFSLLEGVKTIIDPTWKRGEDCKIDEAIKNQYDLVIEKPSPTDWAAWQRGVLTPRLKWESKNDPLYEKYNLPKDAIYVGIQVSAETNYGLWRNWPIRYWQQLIDTLEEMGVEVLLFGYGLEPQFKNRNITDLRGKTNLFELLSIIKHRVYGLVLPDSGISSMVYYLDVQFPIRQVTLWADPNHGILKQNVPSPNPLLKHKPLISSVKDLSTVKVEAVIESLFPIEKTGAILLAGGMGTRLGFDGPKGLFEIGGKTLFQWKCEKMPKNLPLAIMTSPLNHEEIVRYFDQNSYFGLDVHFFQQEMQRLLDQDKKPIDQKAPNGNGSVFTSFCKAGLDRIFKRMGIESIVVSNIENPLSHPLEPSLAFAAKRNDAAVQCILRADGDHPMGMIEAEGGQVKVVEYTHLDPNKEYTHAYSGQIAFRLDFFVEMGKKDLPLHWVQKKIGDRWLWKGEKFIFDALEEAKSAKVICHERQTCYAPVKTTESIPLVETVLR